MSSAPRSFRQIVGLPASTASVRDSTLIIIDAQNEYASGHLTLKHVDQSRKVIADLLSRYRQGGQGKNLVHVVHQVPAGAPVFTPGTTLAEEFTELTPKAGEKIVQKNFPNCFAQTDLHEYLGSLGDIGKKVVLVGYMAHICVSTTARAANERGYEVLVARDAVSTRDIPGTDAEKLQAVVMDELADGFGTIVTADDIGA